MKSFKFKAYGLIWKVKVTNSHPKIKDNFGHFDMAEQTIYISKNATEPQQRSTLLHEIIHLVGETHELNLSEQTVLVLEAGLFHILKDNNLKLY